jgi:hypothetical protein
MTGDAFRSYDELVSEIRKLGLERRTGTLFVVTVDNESGQIGLRDGLIVHVRFRRKIGVEAGYVLRKIDKMRFSFTRDFVETTDPGLSSAAVLAALTDVEVPAIGWHQAPPPPPQQSPGAQEAVRRVLTEALTEYVGPLAAVVVRDHLREAQRAGREPADVVDALARGIDDQASASAFRRQAAAGLARLTRSQR